MLAIHRTFMLELAVLVAFTTAVADAVLTSQEVISCSFVSADSSFARLMLPQLAVKPDLSPAVPSSALQSRDTLQFRADSVQAARVEGLTWDGNMIDTLSRGPSREEMAKRCRDMEAALLGCGWSDDIVVRLLRDVRVEAVALRETRDWTTIWLGAVGAYVGCSAGMAYEPPFNIMNDGGEPTSVIPCGIGLASGGLLGAATGAAIRKVSRNRFQKRHRGIVNDLVREVNRAIASPP